MSQDAALRGLPDPVQVGLPLGRARAVVGFGLDRLHGCGRRRADLPGGGLRLGRRRCQDLQVGRHLPHRIVVQLAPGYGRHLAVALADHRKDVLGIEPEGNQRRGDVPAAGRAVASSHTCRYDCAPG